MINKLTFLITTNKDIGGGIKSTITLLNGLSKFDEYQVKVIVNLDCEFEEKINSEVQVIRLSENTSIEMNKPLQFVKSCQLVKNTFHQHNLYDGLLICSDRPSGMLISIFKKRFKKVMYVSRGGNYENLSARLLRSFFFPKVDAFVGITERQTNILNRYVAGKNITVVYNGVEVQNVRRSKIEEIKNVALIGAISSVKNQLDAVKALKQVNESRATDIQLNIYGMAFTNGDKEYKKLLENYINQQNITFVNFKGYSDNLEQVFEDNDLCISTSISEGFGRTIVESMGYCVPVIANEKAGGPTFIIDHGINGMLYDGSVSDLVKNIEILMNNISHINEIVDTAKEHYHKNFTTEKMVSYYHSIIKTL